MKTSCKKLYPESGMENFGYKAYLEARSQTPRMIFKSKNIYTLYVCDTYQFDDYSKYECSLFDEAHKAEARATVFQDDLKRAFEMGKRLAE